MKTTVLTSSQRRVFRALSRFVEKKGYAPTLSELSDLCGCYPKAIVDTLAVLQRKGYVRRDPRVQRAIHILKPLEEAVVKVG